MTDTSTAPTIRDRFLAVDSSNVADVLDTLGYPDQALSPAFGPYPGDAGKLAGWAYTIRGQMAPYRHSGGDPEKMAACAALSPGAVSVWSGGGEGVAFFGELIAIAMMDLGSVGALVDGGVRDLRSLGELDYPVFARYRTPTQSIGRWKVTGWGEPVSVPGATARQVSVSPGDFVLADIDGAVVVPAAVVEKALEQAEAIGTKERAIRTNLAAGMSLADALAKYGHI